MCTTTAAPPNYEEQMCTRYKAPINPPLAIQLDNWSRIEKELHPFGLDSPNTNC